MIYTFTDLYEQSEYKKGRKRGSRNKYRKPQQLELTEEEKIKRARMTRQNIDTGLRASREVRGYVNLARVFM